MKVDERGKYYTERMSKHSIEVLIVTVHGHIRGHVFVLPGQRVKDLLNNSAERFLAVTDATLTQHDKAANQNFRFIAVNKEFIISVVPMNEEITGQLDEEYRPY